MLDNEVVKAGGPNRPVNQSLTSTQGTVALLGQHCASRKTPGLQCEQMGIDNQKDS